KAVGQHRPHLVERDDYSYAVVTCVLRMSCSASAPVWSCVECTGQNAARGSNDVRSRAICKRSSAASVSRPVRRFSWNLLPPTPSYDRYTTSVQTSRSERVKSKSKSYGFPSWNIPRLSASAMSALSSRGRITARASESNGDLRDRTHTP